MFWPSARALVGRILECGYPPQVVVDPKIKDLAPIGMTGKRIEDTDWEPSIGESVIRLLMPQFTPEYPIRRSREIEAEKANSVGSPPKPLPSTLEEFEAELAEVTAKLEEVTAARIGDPPASQERESLARHMLTLQYRMWELLTLKKVWSEQTK